ncbi:Uma2 family endonuclease [Streptomyces sp. QH1-20]|uniref:Uma2 family endonuclease n=1 Tax=Streptomyces sp. QH1-20 TaxID=3240934 RepID=UPI003511B558
MTCSALTRPRSTPGSSGCARPSARAKGERHDHRAGRAARCRGTIGRAIPDGCLAPEDHFVGQGKWASPEGVLMTVEVTSHDPDTERRDRREKRDGYAAADIPIYLLVDRDACEVVVYSQPEAGKYRNRRTYPYGEAAKVPEPVGINLDSDRFKNYAR